MSKSLNNKRAKKGEILELNAAEISQIEALAVHGHTQQEISNYLGFSDRTFRNIQKRDEDIFSAYTRGRMKAKNFVSSRLMGYIKSDTKSEMSLKAIIFYLKTQGGWLEKQHEALLPLTQGEANVVKTLSREELIERINLTKELIYLKKEYGEEE